MPTSTSPSPQDRGLDPVAVHRVLQRLARAPEAPWLHAEVARRMAQRLSLILRTPGRVVDWWSTLGAGADLLAKAYPAAVRERVEPGADWVAQPPGGRSWWHRLRGRAPEAPVWLQAETLPPGAGLVWSNMALHFVADPAALFRRWHDVLGVDGFVMFSCLGPGTLTELRALYRRLGWPTPTPTFVDMHDLGDMLVEAGFVDPVMDQETVTLHWSDASALLAELRTLGGNTSPQRAQGLRTPRWHNQLRAELQAMAGADGRLVMSFELVYGHAFRGAPRLKSGEVTTVSLEDMRSMVKSRGTPPGGNDRLR